MKCDKSIDFTQNLKIPKTKFPNGAEKVAEGSKSYLQTFKLFTFWIGFTFGPTDYEYDQNGGDGRFWNLTVLTVCVEKDNL